MSDATIETVIEYMASILACAAAASRWQNIDLNMAIAQMDDPPTLKLWQETISAAVMCFLNNRRTLRDQGMPQIPLEINPIDPKPELIAAVVHRMLSDESCDDAMRYWLGLSGEADIPIVDPDTTALWRQAMEDAVVIVLQDVSHITDYWPPKTVFD